MKQEYKQAFTEVNEIIKLMPIELVNKIPNKFRVMIEDERDNEYYPQITEPIEKCKLKNETIVILGLIYRDFLCSPEEKTRLQSKDARELQELEKEIRKQYNPDDIFKKNKVEEKIQPIQTAMIEYKEPFMKKILNIILKFFHLK